MAITLSEVLFNHISNIDGETAVFLEDFDESEVSSTIKELLSRNVSEDSIVVSGAGPESNIPESMWLPADSKLTTTEMMSRRNVRFFLRSIQLQTRLDWNP